MKKILVSLLVISSLSAFAQVQDPWHYEDPCEKSEGLRKEKVSKVFKTHTQEGPYSALKTPLCHELGVGTEKDCTFLVHYKASIKTAEYTKEDSQITFYEDICTSHIYEVSVTHPFTKETLFSDSGVIIKYLEGLHLEGENPAGSYVKVEIVE